MIEWAQWADSMKRWNTTATTTTTTTWTTITTTTWAPKLYVALKFYKYGHAKPTRKRKITKGPYVAPMVYKYGNAKPTKINIVTMGHDEEVPVPKYTKIG